MGSAGGAAEKTLPANAGDARDLGSVPGQEGPLEEEMAILSSISCLKNPMDKGAWGATVYGLAKTEKISKHASKCAVQPISIQSPSEQENKVLERTFSQQKGWIKGGRDHVCVFVCV